MPRIQGGSLLARSLRVTASSYRKPPWCSDQWVQNETKQSSVRNRMEEMDGSLAFTTLPGASEPVRLIVSCGVAAFSAAGNIEKAIDLADEAMYASKQARKRSGKLAG